MDSLHEDNEHINEKRCPRCPEGEQWHPATAAYFGRNNHSKDELNTYCKKCITAANKRYYANHKQQEQERCLLYRSIPENRQRKNETSLDWYAKDIEKNREHARQYFQTERGKIAARAHSSNRRAQARKSGGKHTLAQLQELYKSQKGKCFHCGCDLEESRSSWHADHLIPLSRGGSNDISNIVISCEPCNRRKHNKLPDEWK